MTQLTNLTIPNLTLTNASLQFNGERVTIEADATPELREQVKPKWEPWKPESGDLYFWIDTIGYITHTTFGGGVARLSWKAGNCFPTRELAECQAEIEQITRKLNQAVIAFGGSLAWSRPYMYCAARNGHEEPVGDFYFESYKAADDFSRIHEPTLTRLAELNATLTELWSKHQETIA